MQTFRRQILEINKTQEEKFHTPDIHQLPPASSKTYLLAMFPVATGDHIFNGKGEQEWEIQRDTETQFVIYGM